MKSTRQYSETTKYISLFLSLSLVLVSLVGVNANNSKRNIAAEDVVKYPTLVCFATDMTRLAREGQIQPSAGYEMEIDRVIKSLADGDNRQPVLIDDFNDNKTDMAELIALRMASGNIPENLRGKRLFKLNLPTLFDGVKDKADSAKRVEGVLTDVAKSDGEIILFIDELTNFIGKGYIVSDTLKNSLLQGQVKIVGGSTFIAYNQDINSDSEVAALFETIKVGEKNQQGKDRSKQIAGSGDRTYKGDKVAPDLREMMQKNPTGKKRVDVILQTKNADDPNLRSFMRENKIKIENRIGDSDTLVANLPLGEVEALSDSGMVNSISPDRPMRTFGHIEKTTGTDLIRNQAAGTSTKTDGTGIGIAILDSGVYSSHNAFKDGNGSSRIVYSKNFVDNETTTEDNYGHGTHVAGLALSNASINSSAYKGIATNAKIINLRVLNSYGVGKTSWLLAALDWIKLNHQTYNIKVVNASVGAPAIDAYFNSAICNKVYELTTLGIVVIAAAGNNGKNPLTGQKIYGHIHSPGNEPSAITVGASNSMGTDARNDDVMTSFSSRGPTRSYYTDSSNVKHYDNIIKPDLVAPGNQLISAASSPNNILTAFPNLQPTTLNYSGTNDDMMYMSGTSMSTPLVSGAAALLLQVNPKLTPDMVKLILQYTSQPLNNVNMFEQGAGQLNVEAAVRLAKSIRQDITFNYSVAVGTTILASGASLPTPSSTIKGQTVAWSQGIVTDHYYAKGTALISKYQRMYDLGWSFDDIIFNVSGSAISPNTTYLTSDVIAGNNIMQSNGTALGNGTVFISCGVLMSDGVLLSDGVLMGDGVLLSDGVLFGDGVLMGDTTFATASEVMVTGDPTDYMQAVMEE
jgi:subtilisin family serine protease